MQIILTILLACIPAYIWCYIFYKKDRVYRPKAVSSFILGMISVSPILLYKWSWKYLPEANIFNYTNNLTADIFHFTPYLFLPLGTLFSFMFVGVIEEYMKHIVVHKSDKGFFRNIDDAIEFSIIAALGFSFVENVLYFYYIWQFQGTEVLAVSFVFRSIFSTFAHILFSGIYGYFYGIAYFADPIWSEEQRSNRHPIVNLFHNILHMKKNRVFAIEKVNEGLFLAVGLHAFFNIMLEMNLTFFMAPFLIIGYVFLDKLFLRKENLKAYGYLVGEDSPVHMHHVLWKLAPLALARKWKGKHEGAG